MKIVRILFTFATALLPEKWVAAIYRNRLPSVDGRQIDPKAHALSELVTLLRDPNQAPELETSRKQLVKMAKRFDLRPPKTVAIENITLPGAKGDRPARVYTPIGWTRGTLLYLHGGGWVQGDLESHNGLCSNLAALSNTRVISYDYLLAPEHKFPAGLMDVIACYKALVDGETAFQISAEEFAVGGDSAGGNLTAALMHCLANEGAQMPKAQLLIYPALDATLTSHSIESLRDQPLLTKQRIQWFLDLYLEEGQNRKDPMVSPLFTDQIDKMPATKTIVGGHDPLWDDALAFHERLTEAGVASQLTPFPGQVHIFASVGRIMPQGVQALEICAEWLNQQFA